MGTARAAKRTFDYVAAAGGLVALSPLLALIAVAIKVDSPGSALFTQERVGKDGRTFRVLKFRTMRAGAPVRFNPDGSTQVELQDARITRVGRFLRGALDELPQLVNVLRGEMSLVGPRPDMPVHAEQYTAEERRKLTVLPGVTSLAAVMGRNDIPWKQRIAIDLKYIDHWSLWLDARIIAQTVLLAIGLRAFGFDDVIARSEE